MTSIDGLPDDGGGRLAASEGRSRRPPVARPPEPSPEEVLKWPRLPAAAGPAGALSQLYLLTLLSAVDGSLVLLAAAGQLSDPGSAVAIGLTVVAGAGAWLAAHRAYAGRPTRRDLASLAVLGAVTVAATVASVAIGLSASRALTLHVLPKAAGVVLMLVAAEVAGLRVARPLRTPLPVWATAGAVAVEAAVQWIP